MVVAEVDWAGFKCVVFGTDVYFYVTEAVAEAALVALGGM